MYSISIPPALVALVLMPQLQQRTENTRDNMLWQWQWWRRQRWRVMWWYDRCFLYTRAIIGLGHLFFVFRWWFLFCSVLSFCVFSYFHLDVLFYVTSFFVWTVIDVILPGWLALWWWLQASTYTATPTTRSQLPTTLYNAWVGIVVTKDFHLNACLMSVSYCIEPVLVEITPLHAATPRRPSIASSTFSSCEYFISQCV